MAFPIFSEGEYVGGDHCHVGERKKQTLCSGGHSMDASYLRQFMCLLGVGQGLLVGNAAKAWAGNTPGQSTPQIAGVESEQVRWLDNDG